MTKKILITGGNRGVGLEVTKLAVEQGMDVYVVARDFSNFDIDGVTTIEYDLSDVENISTIKDKTGDIDILINNAGIMYYVSLEDYTREQEQSIININMRAPVELAKLYLKGMTSNGEGRIVNVASIAGHIGTSDMWYGISKAAMINFTKSVAKSYGPLGIVTNSVAPGPIQTDMLKTISKERQESMKRNAISEEFVTPDKVAETIMWLATDSPTHINGTCIDINDGMYLR